MLHMSAVIGALMAAPRVIASRAIAFLAIALMTAVLPPAPAHAAEPEAAFRYGLSAYNAGNYARALATWEPIARAGDAQAQAALGVMHYAGRGVPRDSARAARLFSLAAE
jgi:TPR repeat protein